MKNSKRTAACAAGICVSGILLGGIGRALDKQLSINGTLISSRVRVIEGESWVPVRDLAKAQGLAVTGSGGNINLVTAGGANQTGSLAGKVGDTLFDGKWRFTLSSFEQVQNFKPNTQTSTDYGVYSPVAEADQDTYTAKPGFKLYVADCTLKNAMPKEAQYDFSTSDNRSAVADTTGVNHPWIVFDIASTSFFSKPMLPGAALNFRICFAVADSAKPQDVVITLMALGDHTGTDIRFHLNK